MLQIDFLSQISLIGILGSGIFFWIYSKKNGILNPSLNQYLLADRQISKKDFVGSFLASGVSLGGYIMFFIGCHKIYGWLMIIGPIFYVITNLIFLLVLRRINPNQIEYKTFSELWFAVFPCKITAKLITIVSVIACLLFFFIEVHVGSAILYILLPKFAVFKHLAFFFIGLTVLAYAYRGGYLAVVKTDRLQLMLILGASLALCIFAICIPVNKGFEHNIIGRLLSYEEPNNFTIGIFITWIILSNICGCLIEPTALQRINATKSVKEAFLGILKSMWPFVFVLLILLLSFLLINTKGYAYNNLEEFLHIIKNQTGMFSYMIYPAIVVGFCAALFSTADTYAIAVIYNICTQTAFSEMFQKTHAIQKHFLQRFMVLAFGGIVLLMTILHYAIESSIGFLITPVLHAMWGVLSILAPFSVYSLYRLAKKLPAMQANLNQKIILLIFGMLYFTLIFYGTLKSIITGTQTYIHVTSLIALVTISVGIFCAVKLENQHCD